MGAVSVRPPSALLVCALGLTGFGMRTAVTSVGAVLDDLQHDLGLSGTVAGLVTMLPVISFAAFGALTPRLARHVGGHRLLVATLVISGVAMALRPVGSSVPWFVVGSLLALVAGAVSNVLLPSLVKEHFPDRIGPMTALYTSALAVGTTAGAGLTVPIGTITTGSWRGGLASWSVWTLLAVLPWLPTTRRDHSVPEEGRTGVPMNALLHSRTAWALTAFFAMQSWQAYISFGWFARFLDDHGISSGTAGAMVALLAATGIPISLIVPRVAPERLRAVTLLLGACYLVAYVGMAAAPVGGAWVWMLLVGIGSGMFPVALTLIGLRSRTAGTTAALSAFMQSIGYVVAGCGPLLFGALFDATGSWALPMTVLFVALAITVVAAWPSTADRYVDDELATSRA
jgi:CP family cyanate transporter-like MFS transporter